ncbi:MAG: prolyl oligopeptidase family serine peptidase, partial [Oscillospiraceae bacterium]|nr:prolyl oligopeptidase family serine peptidase [Oscillospiraceae bacterium]
YVDMMPKLIDLWRGDFKDETLPFYYVQLCRLGETRDENNPDTTANGEVYVRQAQTDTYLNAENKTNLGVVGTLDIYGKYEYPNTQNDANCRNDIHPGQKKIIGERLAAFALKDVYGKDVYTTGPMPKEAVSQAGRIIITYDCNGSLKIMDSKQYADTVTDGKIKSGAINPDVLNEFEIAGEDGKWYEATAQITSGNQVTVYSDKVSEPTMVRYGYEDYPEAPNLTDDSNLPSYVFEMAAEISDEEWEGVTITSADKDSVEIMAYGNIAEAVIITASYNDGLMENVTVSEKTQLNKGTNTINLPKEVKIGDKIMVWNSLDGMKPYGEAYTVPAPGTDPTPTPTPTPDPTPTPTPESTPIPDTDNNLLLDGNIEKISTVPDGSWKPTKGEWKKGLGTSVDIDTSIVSDNSTKSAKITNAALFQGVTLTSGKTYTLSFDIYIGESFDNSKLSFGIYTVEGSYAKDIKCGYKDGTAYTELSFDQSKKNEWQHVETEFTCTSDAMYATNFLYGASDSIYVDNVYLTDGEEPTMTISEHTVTYSDDNGTYSLYGKMYRPVGVEECGVVIFSSGFAGGCDDFPSDCKLLAENGYASFTFEFAGGSTKMQSTGRKTTEMSIMTEKKDLLAVFDYVSNLDGIDTGNIFLAGASQGGMISAMAAEELGDKVKRMALYFPAYNIPDDWRKIYPTVSDVPETFDKWGFKLGKVFCTDMIDYYPFEGDNIGKYKGNVLIMQGDADTTVPLKTAQEAVKHYENAELVVYEGEGHGFSAPNAQAAREKLLEFITKE